MSPLALLLLSLAPGDGDWEVIELELPTNERCMAPRFSEGSAWLSWVEVGEDDGWVLAAADLGSQSPERVALRAGEEGAWFVNWADRPTLSVDAGGAWLASWLKMSGEGTYAYDALISSSVDEGEHWSAPTKLHSDHVQGEHGFVSLLARSGEGWGACWLDGRAMGGGHDSHGHPAGDMQLRFAHVDYEGQVSAERILDERVCECCPTALSPLPGGGAVLVYRDRGADETRDFAYVYCKDSALDRWSSPRAVHEDGWRVEGCPVNGAALAAHGDELALAWFTMGTDATPRILCAWWDSERSAFGRPRTLGEGQVLGRIAAAMLPTGELAVTWLESSEGADVAEWRLSVSARDSKDDDSQALCEAHASRASGISALHAVGGELLFSHTDVVGRKVRALRLVR